MNIDITAKKFDLTDSLRTFVEKKLNQLLKFDGKITEVRAILEVDDGHHRHGRINGCEIILHTGITREELVTRDWQEDMHTAINNSVNAMEVELKKHKGKHSSIDQEGLRRLKEEGE